MYNIAVCDDECLFCSECENMIEQFAKMRFEEINVDIYYTTEAVEKDIEAGKHIDLIFLDIEFEGQNGVTLGRKIREKFENNTMCIVFVSGKNTYAMELFAVRPLDFLIKPINEERFFNTLDLFLKLAGRNKHIFEYMCEYKKKRIEISKILYFKSMDKEIHMVTDYGEERFFSTLKKIEEMLSDYRFIRCHNSFLVNYDRVEMFYYDKLYMDNKMIPIAQTKRKEVRKMQLKIEMGRTFNV
ncbi:MAG: LytTR family DNA-binding domain-containing protein [Alistipes sp.]|nr:LytTR family DNA-binding domain-containing protein [Alistipes sp.]